MTTILFVMSRMTSFLLMLTLFRVGSSVRRVALTNLSNLSSSSLHTSSLPSVASHYRFKHRHVCDATSMEPSLAVEMDSLVTEIKDLGDSIREMKKRMKEANGDHQDMDKKKLEDSIATLLEMKGRYAGMQKAAEEVGDVARQNDDSNDTDDHTEGTNKKAEKYIDTSKLAIRPTLDDVERISKGQAAKRRGTGSRAVPHRLNEMERKEW